MNKCELCGKSTNATLCWNCEKKRVKENKKKAPKKKPGKGARFLALAHLMLLSLLTFSIGCDGGGGAAGGGAGGEATPTAKAVAITPTVYTFELSGNGVTFSADMHGYSQVGFAGTQVNPTYNSVLLGAATNTYTMTAESMISSFTLNTGAGVLTIVTKKNGSVIRTDTISANATSISISN